jgi:hypothetical protein
MIDYNDITLGYNDITLDIDEDGIWLIDNTDQGDMQMGHVSWQQVAIHVQKELEKLKEDDTDAQVNLALKEAQERTKGMLTEGDTDREMSKHFVEMADKIEELEAENKKLRLEVYHANDVADVSIDKAKDLEAKLSGAMDFVQATIRYAGNVGDDYLAGVAREILAELKGDSDD